MEMTFWTVFYGAVLADICILAIIYIALLWIGTKLFDGPPPRR